MVRPSKNRDGKSSRGEGARRRSSSSHKKRSGKRHERQSSTEECSLNSSSTDSTRPTVHTNRRTPGLQASGSGSRSIEEVVSDKSNRLSKNTANNNRSGTPRSDSRQRVPGGAAAKLMLRGPQKSRSSEASNYSASSGSNNNNDRRVNNNNNNNNNGMSDDDDGPVDTSEIYETITKTKAEFEKGPTNVGRYSPVTIVGNEEIEVSFQCTGAELALQPEELHNSNKQPLPNILSREEAYHENASAAVAAILTPTSRGGDNASAASGMTDHYSLHSHMSASRISASQAGGGSVVSAFQSPKYNSPGGGDTVPSAGSGGLDSMTDDYDHQGGGGGGGGQGLHKSPTTEPLISCTTEEKLDNMSSKMADPSKTLSDLLRAIASPDDITMIDRAYMVRRKNACGALKVLTAHNRRRKQICWTVGVLPALTSVLQDAGEERLDIVYPDPRTRAEYEETRRRAIAALTNLAMPVPNRLAVFHTPGLVQALIAIVKKEDGECLEGACAILAYLAKSNENRLLMAQVPGLYEAVLRVLKPRMNDEQKDQRIPKRDYPWSSSASDSDNSSASSADDDEDDEDASVVSGSTDVSSEGETSEEDLDEELLEEPDFTDEDEMSTDGESVTGSEASCDSSVSESSAEDSRSEHRPRSKRNKAQRNNQSKPGILSTHPPKLKLHSNFDKDRHISGARKNLFAMLGHLVKEKDNAYRLARVNDLVPVVVEISRMHESPIHVLAVQFLAHLTRHRLNSKLLVFKVQVVLPALVKATYSATEASRRYACFAIQNFSHDKSCRQELATSEKLIIALCKRARHSKDPEERLAAICALKNLTDEPANLIPLSNTAECIATLMQIAHGQEEGVTELMQFKACDALATISHWLRKIATNGQSMDAVKHGELKPTGMFVPSLKVVGWERYE